MEVQAKIKMEQTQLRRSSAVRANFNSLKMILSQVLMLV
jgi:hypothetical protein